jgi:hypothetical protein
LLWAWFHNHLLALLSFNFLRYLPDYKVGALIPIEVYYCRPVSWTSCLEGLYQINQAALSHCNHATIQFLDQMCNANWNNISFQFFLLVNGSRGEGFFCLTNGTRKRKKTSMAIQKKMKYFLLWSSSFTQCATSIEITSFWDWLLNGSRRRKHREEIKTYAGFLWSNSFTNCVP